MVVQVLSSSEADKTDSMVGGSSNRDMSSSGSLTADLDNATSKDTCS